MNTQKNPVSADANTNPFDQGFAAGKRGDDAFMNPYCLPSNTSKEFEMWHRGWCAGHQY